MYDKLSEVKPLRSQGMINSWQDLRKKTKYICSYCTKYKYTLNAYIQWGVARYIYYVNIFMEDQ